MTAAAAARLLCHRATRVRTMRDLIRLGDALGVPRHPVFAVYLLRWSLRVAEIKRLANTVGPYRATGRGIYRN